jgi:outer membrane protein TolC
LAQSLYEDNQRRLKAGRSSMNDVLVDQNRLAEAEILAINGWADAHLLYARFCHSIGRRVDFERPGCR